jgi:uncharacterized protein (DUF1800 family)
MNRTLPLRPRSPLRASRRGWPLVLAAALGTIALVVSSTSPAPSTVSAAAELDEATIAHVLNRVAFGPTPRETLFIRAFGLDRFLDDQLTPEKLPDTGLAPRLAGLETLALSSREMSERYFAPVLELRQQIKRSSATDAKPARSAQGSDTGTMTAAEAERPRTAEGALADLSPEERQRVMAARKESQRVLQELAAQKILRATYSERQLEEVLVDFWFNHFNVFAGKGPVQAYLTAYERDAIRPHVLGRFRELLGAVAHSPAMLFYLDNWQSSDPDMAPRAMGAGKGGLRRAPQVRTGEGARIGTNARGRQSRAGRDRLAAMSDEERERARAAIAQRMPRGLNENYARELLELHTLGVDAGYTQQDIVEVAKAFTGWTIRGPRQGGDFFFDDRRHVKGAKQVLGTRIDRGGEQDGEAVLDLLASHPATATFIATKLARRFVSDEPPRLLVERAAETFRRTRGDLREVTRTIVTAPELLAPDARRAKVKTPFEFVASALRASGAEVTDATPLVRQLRELGMPLYFAQPPTGYADRADAWVNTGALLGRMNFALALVDNRIAGARVDLTAVAGGGTLDEVRARLVATVLAGDISESTRKTLGQGAAVAQLAALTLGSPEFQRR